MNRSLILLPLVSLALLSGCASAPPGAMSREQLQVVRNAQHTLAIGTPRDKALAAFPHANTVRMSAARIEGVDVEEWKVEAFNDDDSKKARDLFVQFLYFADGKLVDMSDTRIDFRSKPDIVKLWSGGGA